MSKDTKNLWQWVLVTSLLMHEKWVVRFASFKKVILGFSGGVDSTVLLHLLASYPDLHHQITALHVNHGISQHADAWQAHCEAFCASLGVHFIAEAVEVNGAVNLEERARKARHLVFSREVGQGNCLLLGHHMDDQAETVLLQLFRGSGVDGLAAMEEESFLGDTLVFRPFLSKTREQILQYAIANRLSWIDDESNMNTTYSRNFLRHQIIPLLQSKWPGVSRSLARTARHCQQAKLNLIQLALEDCPELSVSTPILSLELMNRLSASRVGNVLRLWLKNNKVALPSSSTFDRIVHEVMVAGVDAQPEVAWGNVLVRRYRHQLYLDKQFKMERPLWIEWHDFPHRVTWFDPLFSLSARPSDQGLKIPDKAKIHIRFRQGGEEMIWRNQTKKLKKLFQEWHVPPWMRERIPLIYINGELAAIPGYAISDVFFTKNKSEAWAVVGINTPVN